jgi:hypothetical protein
MMYLTYMTSLLTSSYNNKIKRQNSATKRMEFYAVFVSRHQLEYIAYIM